MGVNEQEPPHRREILEEGRRGAIMWTAFAILLIVGALVVPMGWVDSFKGIFGKGDPAVDAFSQSVADLDEALEEGRDPGLSPGELERLLPHLQTRRLHRAGPMTAQEVRRATTLFVRFNRLIRNETTDEGRRVVRQERNRRLLDEIPRLDPAKVSVEMTKLREGLERAGYTPWS